jgi:hypothetical protein
MTTTTSDGIREHELRDALDIHDAEVMHIDRTWVTITMRTADLDRLVEGGMHQHDEDCVDVDEIPAMIDEARRDARAGAFAEIAKLAEAS